MSGNQELVGAEGLLMITLADGRRVQARLRNVSLRIYEEAEEFQLMSNDGSVVATHVGPMTMDASMDARIEKLIITEPESTT